MTEQQIRDIIRDEIAKAKEHSITIRVQSFAADDFRLDAKIAAASAVALMGAADGRP